MSRVVLVLGGARSGKSSFAERLAQSAGDNSHVAYVATARPSDAEMQARIAKHVDDRRSSPPSARWTTVECPVGLSLLAPPQLPAECTVVLVDCLTVWLANWMAHLGYPSDETVDENAVAWAEKVDSTARAEIAKFLDRMRADGRTVILVANEVGLGIVPMGKVSRYYRDTLGRINQDIGRRPETERVYMMIAGFGVDIKRLSDEATLAQNF
ncbi:hypothetical protein HDU83_006150 [Entophlyctis luteolus]|nr:hypothetical protein HDU83_006150 [Entophlyctis luteolus]